MRYAFNEFTGRFEFVKDRNDIKESIGHILYEYIEGDPVYVKYILADEDESFLWEDDEGL